MKLKDSAVRDEDDRSVDCGFMRGNQWFRMRVGAIIIEEGYMLFGFNRKNDFYYTVGGGIHLGESTEEAIKREVYEETGIAYEIDKMAFVHEYFFNLEFDGVKRECQEVSFYYLMKPQGRRLEISKESYTLGMREEFIWIPLNKLNEHNGYPQIIKKMVEDIVLNEKCTQFHYITKEEGNEF